MLFKLTIIYTYLNNLTPMFKYFNKEIWLTESIIQKLVDINN